MRAYAIAEKANRDAYSNNDGVCLIDPTRDDCWDRDLAENPESSFFHTSAWARVLKHAYGYKPVYFAIRGSSGRIKSCLPMIEVDSWLTGRRGVSLPFTDECASLGSDPAELKALYKSAVEYAGLRRWKYVEYRGRIQFIDGAKPSVSFLGHRLDLRDGENALFERFEGSVRRAIRKAEKGGVSIEFSTGKEAIRTFHSLLCKTRKRHGVPPQPFSFFESIQEHVLSKNQGWVVLARLGKVPIAGAVHFHFGRKGIYKFGASDEAYNELRANNLVMWEAIKRHTKDGFENLDFGRTSLTNVGLQKFKLSWGASEHRIDYARRDSRSGGYVVVNDSATGLATRIFGKLPDAVFESLGSVLYKHMA